MKKWYALSTKPNLESVAVKNLERQEVQVYFPRVYKKINNFTKTIYEAFFPGYLFVRLDIKNDRWHKVNYTIGVKKLISFGNCPVNVPDKIINDLKIFEDDNGIIINSISFQKGENIVIDSGIFSGNQAIFDSYLFGKDRVRVLLNVMGISTGINLNSHHIQKN